MQTRTNENKKNIENNIAVAIPAYNEERSISKTIIKSQKYTKTVIVYDDGSMDMTREIAKRLGAIVIFSDTHLGKGEALRACFEKARELEVDILITIDADDQHNPDEIPRITLPIIEGKADVTVGSRFLEKDDSVPKYRIVGNRILNIITNKSNKGVTDTQSGFRAYNKKALNVIRPGEMGMGVDSEILMDLSENEIIIKEVPISVKYHENEKTSSHNPIYHTLDVILSVIKLVSIRHPLKFYCIPGAVLFITSLMLGWKSFTLFEEGMDYWINFALMATVSLLIGVQAIFVGITLFTVNTIIRKN